MQNIKKNKVVITLLDPTFSSGSVELGPAWDNTDPNRLYIGMKWESKDGPQSRQMSLDIEELKNAIRLVEDAEYE